MYNAVFDVSVLLSCFMLPEIVTQFKNMLGEEANEDPLNYLTTDKLFVGFLPKSKVNEMLYDGTISDREEKFIRCLSLFSQNWVFVCS